MTDNKIGATLAMQTSSIGTGPQRPIGRGGVWDD